MERASPNFFSGCAQFLPHGFSILAPLYCEGQTQTRSGVVSPSAIKRPVRETKPSSARSHLLKSKAVLHYGKRRLVVPDLSFVASNSRPPSDILYFSVEFHRETGSCTSVRICVMSLWTSEAVAPPRLTIKLACLVETSAPPILKPFNSERSINAPARGALADF